MWGQCFNSATPPLCDQDVKVQGTCLDPILCNALILRNSVYFYTSRAAAGLFGVEKLLCGIVGEDASEELLEERWTMPWAQNTVRIPHVLYVDRHGVYHYTEPLYQREDPAYRVCIVDDDGLVKGVLWAVDF